jgi:hypothetical protein
VLLGISDGENILEIWHVTLTAIKGWFSSLWGGRGLIILYYRHSKFYDILCENIEKEITDIRSKATLECEICVRKQMGRAMAQAVSRRPLIAEAQFRPRVSPCGISGGQSGTGTGCFPEYFRFPLLVSFRRCFITWKNNKKKTDHPSHHLHHRVAQ